MKIIWEEGDIRPGRRVGQAGMLERHIIGYRPERSDTHRYCLVSLADGMVMNTAFPKIELCKTLNLMELVPEELLESERRPPGVTFARK